MQLTAAGPSAADPNTLTPSVRSSNVTSPSRYKRTPLITTTRIISAPFMPALAGNQHAGRGSDTPQASLEGEDKRNLKGRSAPRVRRAHDELELVGCLDDREGRIEGRGRGGLDDHAVAHPERQQVLDGDRAVGRDRVVERTV